MRLRRYRRQARVPRTQQRYDVQVLARGMTEMSPIGTVCTVKPKQQQLGTEERMAVQAKQGRAVFGVDLKIGRR